MFCDWEGNRWSGVVQAMRHMVYPPTGLMAYAMNMSRPTYLYNSRIYVMRINNYGAL